MVVAGAILAAYDRIVVGTAVAAEAARAAPVTVTSVTSGNGAPTVRLEGPVLPRDQRPPT